MKLSEQILVDIIFNSIILLILLINMALLKYLWGSVTQGLLFIVMCYLISIITTIIFRCKTGKLDEKL
ncbi:hypothetical protein A9Z60_03680 [Moraxella nonliquefaciens]|uniref:Uncharacterized protein n=1 Tax=Moraxella nonliquefaciens TaxID=478 RepID=A0A1B8PIF1_MORNO|nr:hypothetical protein A9Z60_03680 [Moraxella nonliquefaciens]